MNRTKGAAMLLSLLLLLSSCFYGGTKETAESTRKETEDTAVTGKEESAPMTTDAVTEKPKELTGREKKYYQPTSLTMSLYDAERSLYGFTWNTEKTLLSPTVRYQKGEALTGGAWEEVTGSCERESSYNINDKTFSYYVSKVTVPLEPDTVYTYQAGDAETGVFTEPVTYHTADPTWESFTFAHLSDSQTSCDGHITAATGITFGKVLKQVLPCDFAVHTGDVVEFSKYETYWKDMLHYNFPRLSLLPVMALSGNHETSYHCGSREIFKHFHYAMPEQDTVEKGFYYGFTYGNVKFLMLNTNMVDADGLWKDQLDWLTAELAGNTCRYTVVCLHNPIYSAGTYGACPDRNQLSMALRAQLTDLFASYHVDLVLQGHDHVVTRTYPIGAGGVPQKEDTVVCDGCTYIKNPGGPIYLTDGASGEQGKSLYAVDEALFAYADNSPNACFAEISVTPEKLTVEVACVKNGERVVLHRFGIMK